MSLVGLLIALLILGAVGGVAAISLSGSSARVPGITFTTIKGAGSQPGRTGPAPIQGAASVATCRTDFIAVAEAASKFEVMKGRPAQSIQELGAMLKDPARASTFTITIDPNHPGQIDVATPGHPAQQGDANCAYA